ncbi:MAG: helix-turn-helix domain-containing protein [Oscillospiraceae bacterium]|nr:helix-turn-helix domain-containing protein [Oscillospiraceae bacterium]
MKNFSECLKVLRESKKLTQKQVANGMGISERAYQRYEGEGAKPSFDALIALSDFFDISADYFLGRLDDKKGQE